MISSMNWQGSTSNKNERNPEMRKSDTKGMQGRPTPLNPRQVRNLLID
jgi:hypothetical protein